MMILQECSEHNFLGRKHEIRLLEGVASDAVTGEAGSVFLSGKRGVGKTKLLRCLFSSLFKNQGDTVPFFYAIRTSFGSIENFSRDYLSTFILQALAFYKKDSSILDATVYSLEELAELAKEAAANWAVDMIDDFYQAGTGSTPMKSFFSAIAAPHKYYQSTGMPVMVMIDDFHKMRTLCEFNDGKNRDSNFWICYENVIQSLHTPHIFTGLQSELDKMFFEDTSLGNALEIINLPGLNKVDSERLFNRLCESYGLKIEEEAHIIDTFGGNPFYIKNFLQAARQAGMTFTEDDLWLIYCNEVTGGKTYMYWTSLLKSFVPQFNLRKPALRLLHCLVGEKNGNHPDPHSVSREEREHIMSLLQVSGAVETGFSEMELVDEVLVDVIRGLYHREINSEPLHKIRDIILQDKQRHIKTTEAPSFYLRIPAEPRAELVALNSLQQVALHFNIPSDITGQLQVALIQLLTGIISGNGVSVDSFDLKFRFQAKTFSVEIATLPEDFVLTDDDRSKLKAYLNDVVVEKIMKGTKITLIKDLGQDFVSAS